MAVGGSLYDFSPWTRQPSDLVLHATCQEGARRRIANAEREVARAQGVATIFGLCQ